MSYLPGFIDDVRRQTYTNWELIIVSNGKGQEAQFQLAKELTQDIKNAKVIMTPLGGVSLARNLGLEQAEGEWVCFLDADDRLSPNHLGLLISAVCEHCDVVEGGFSQIDINGKESSFIFPSKEYNLALNAEGHYEYPCLEAIDKVDNAPWNKLFRKSFLMRNRLCYDTRFTLNEDKVFMMQAFLAAAYWKFIPMTGYTYKASYGSAMSRYHANVEESWQMYLDLKDELKYRAGISKQQLTEERVNMQYFLVWQYIWNMFKPGCPLSYFDKVRYIRKMIHEEKFIISCKRHDWKNEQRIRFKAFYYCTSTGSGNIVAMLFAAQHYGKQLINKIKKTH